MSRPANSVCIPLFSSSASHTTAQNKGQVIDAAMVDGCAYLGSFLLASRNLGIWTGDKEIHSRLKFDQSDGCSCPEIGSVTSIIGPLSVETSLES